MIWMKLTELNSKQTNLVDIYVRDMLHPDGLMNIQDATIVIVYAGREATRKLAPILKRRLRSGTRAQDVVDTVIQRLNLTTDDILFDLGCGEGHWCISASKASGCQSIGIELSEEIAERARQRSLTELNSKQTNLVDIYVRDMLHPDGLMNIQDATIVIVYAGREATRKLAPILKRRLRSGTLKEILKL